MNLKELAEYQEQVIQATLNNRERLTQAFVAETGLVPSECVMVEMDTHEGRKFWVESKDATYAKHDAEKLRSEMRSLQSINADLLAALEATIILCASTAANGANAADTKAAFMEASRRARAAIAKAKGA